ncbi:MAG: class I SAM-dependent methyltransferase [Legionella sp.]|nr:class I SAM-dependent methyltransferase [Legionella sp.]
MPPKIWKPEEYNKQCVLQYNTAMSMLDTFSFKGNEKVLDIGCGTGNISYQVATQRLTTGKLTGLDISHKMINFASKHYQAPNLSFEHNDVLTMRHGGCFDIALSFWTLSWVSIENQLEALKNIIRSLNGEGKFFLMYPLKHEAYNIVDTVIKKPEWQPFFKGYSMPRSFITEEQYQDNIISNIPMDISIEKKEIECRYKNDDEMLSSINCWLAHVDEIPHPKDKEKFLLDVVAAYKKYRNINEPTMFYSILEITGNKNTLENKFRNACRVKNNHPHSKLRLTCRK